MSATSDTDRLFTPVWAGGWKITRIVWALAALWAHVPKIRGIEDAFAAPDMVFTTGWYRLADFVTLTPMASRALWAVGVLGLLCVLWGGKLFRVGLVLWFVGAWGLLGYEALDVKAHDRLMTWMSYCLFLSPAGERGLTQKWRSPVARNFLLIVFCSLYMSTGLTKLAHESTWWNGQALAYHLLHQYHAGSPLAAWVSGQTWITLPLGCFTLIAEIAFTFLVFFRRTNPVAIGMVLALHLGIQALMHVSTFSVVAISAYPVLLHPDIAREWWERWQTRRQASADRA